jgi:hypothetical protein
MLAAGLQGYLIAQRCQCQVFCVPVSGRVQPAHCIVSKQKTYVMLLCMSCASQEQCWGKQLPLELQV